MLRNGRICSSIHFNFFVESPVEILKPGNQPGDNGNWRLIIVGNDIKLQQKVSGIWKQHGFIYRGA